LEGAASEGLGVGRGSDDARSPDGPRRAPSGPTAPYEPEGRL